MPSVGAWVEESSGRGSVEDVKMLGIVSSGVGGDGVGVGASCGAWEGVGEGGRSCDSAVGVADDIVSSDAGTSTSVMPDRESHDVCVSCVRFDSESWPGLAAGRVSCFLWMRS
jgi:hypothetical protein